MLLSFQQSVCLKKHWLRSYVFFKKLDIPKIYTDTQRNISEREIK